MIIQRICLMINELYDPNYRERATSKTRIYQELMRINQILNSRLPMILCV